MSNEAFQSIRQGLLEAIAHAKGDTRGVRMHYPSVAPTLPKGEPAALGRPGGGTVDVKAVRAKVGMTQEQFAGRFGFSVATLRHWERGDRAPRGPALVLLGVIAHNPQAVMDALAA